MIIWRRRARLLIITVGLMGAAALVAVLVDMVVEIVQMIPMMMKGSSLLVVGICEACVLCCGGGPAGARGVVT